MLKDMAKAHYNYKIAHDLAIAYISEKSSLVKLLKRKVMETSKVKVL